MAGEIMVLFYLIGLMVGSSVIAVSALFYRKFGKRVILLFMNFIAALLFIQLGLLFKNMEAIAGINGGITLAKVFDLIGTAAVVAAAPMVAEKLGGEKVKLFFWGTLAVVEGLLIALGFSTGETWIKWCAKGVLFSVIILSSVKMVLAMVRSGDVVLKKVLREYLVFGGVAFPVIVLEGFREYIPYIRNVQYIEIMSLPLFFMAVNIISLRFGMYYLDTPSAVEAESGTLSDYFTERYNITEREAEIIELIREGLTYKEIGERLFIAYKTVDNHIQGIYRKTGVGSKQQLRALIESNS